MISPLRASRLLVAALALLLLSACVAVSPAPESATPDTSTEAPAGEAAVEEGAYPVTIEHKFGSTTIESAPQRVLSLGFTDQDALLALDTVPIGVRYFFGPADDQIWPWAEAALGDGITEVINIPFGEMSFEQIVALNPDLIVGISAGFTQEEYDMLAQIAPTLAQSSDYVDFGVPWQEQTRVIGEALGKSAAAEQLIEETEARFATARAEHPEFVGATSAIAMPSFDGSATFFSGPQHERQRFLTNLGFVLPDALAETAGDSFYGSLGPEQIGMLDTDVLLWVVSPDQAELIQADPLYQTLAVAQEGRDLFLDSTGEGDMAAPAIIVGSVLSLPYAIDLLVPQLAEKVAQ